MLGVPIVQKGRFEQTYLGLLPIWLEHPRGVISINFNLPSPEAFDGNSNSLEHTLAFYVFIWYLECFMYRTFTTMLKGSVWEWCNRMNLFLIYFFTQLAKEFELHFLENIHPRLFMTMLLELR